MAVKNSIVRFDQSDHPILAVAFDMDGLLFNTEDLYDEVGELLLQRRGLSFSLELKLMMMGLPGKKAFQIMKDYHGLDDSVDGLIVETREIFADLLPARIETMPGLFSLLQQLEEKGIPKCVATSSHREFAKKALGHFDLESRFEFVLTSEDVENGKPAPDIYLLAAKKFSIAPSSMLVLEDSKIGSTAGASAGASVIAVPTRHSRDADFSHVHAVATSLEDPLIAQRLFPMG